MANKNLIEPFTSVMITTPALIELHWAHKNFDLVLKIEGKMEKLLYLTVNVEGFEKKLKRKFKKSTDLITGQMLHIGYYSSELWMTPPYEYINFASELEEINKYFEPQNEPLLTLLYEISGMRASSEYTPFTVTQV